MIAIKEEHRADCTTCGRSELKDGHTLICRKKNLIIYCPIFCAAYLGKDEFPHGGVLEGVINTPQIAETEGIPAEFGNNME